MHEYVELAIARLQLLGHPPVPITACSKEKEMDILDYFDVKNVEHLKAYVTLQRTGTWPEGFIPKGTTFSTQWSLRLLSKLAFEYTKIMGANEK